MGKKIDGKIIYIVLLLLLTSFFVYQDSRTSGGGQSRLKLKDFMYEIDGYQRGADIVLENDVTHMLKLDDYVFTNYTHGKNSATLYIGHYYSLAKLTAAHSPLACYPSQGWIIESPVNHQLVIGNDTLNFSELIATLGDKKELILFWYQAMNKSSQHIFPIKITTLINKLQNNNEQHGFVRVSVPISGMDQEQARATGLTFIKAFWPHYLDYIKNNIPNQ